MNSIKVKLSELKKPEKNVRIHTPKQLSEFVRSVKMFGQIRPIVIDENNMILAGNGLFDALMAAEYTEAECYQYTDLTENQKKKLMIADNKIFSLGIENIDTLNSFIADLSEDLDIPGYDSEILRQMIADADEVTEKLAEYGTLQIGQIEEIRQAGERRDARIQAAANEEHNNSSGTNESIKIDNNSTANERPGETTDIQKYVICPKCVEKIWL